MSSKNIDNIDLVKSSISDLEQYDAFYEGNKIGFFLLKDGVYAIYSLNENKPIYSIASIPKTKTNSFNNERVRKHWLNRTKEILASI